MALNQLSVFVDNTPGALSDIAEVLANADINLRALSIADTERFGILRMIVSDNKMAVSVLKGKGYIVKEIWRASTWSICTPSAPGRRNTPIWLSAWRTT